MFTTWNNICAVASDNRKKYERGTERISMKAEAIEHNDFAETILLLFCDWCQAR
jgi:hypothetical protein